MSAVVELKAPHAARRKDYADRLRQMADDIEADDGKPVAMAVVVFTAEPWNNQSSQWVDWSNPWPRAVFAEAVKYELLRDIEKRGEAE